jgi:hypothetical protein
MAKKVIFESSQFQELLAVASNPFSAIAQPLLFKNRSCS